MDNKIRLIMQQFIKDRNIAELASSYIELKNTNAPSSSLEALGRYLDEFIDDARWNVPRLVDRLSAYVARTSSSKDIDRQSPK